MYAAQDAAEELRDTRDGLSYSAEELEEIESRLDTIHRLKRKYGSSCEEILQFLENAKTQLDEIEFASDRIERLEKQLHKAKKEAEDAALALRAARNETAEKLAEGEAEIETLTKDMKYYPYYLEAYSAALGGLVGEYEAEVIGEDGQSTWQKKYGLKGYCPIARGFDYTHYDDFGAGRSYGYKRRHLGHDMMGLVGVPIIAVESGTVEALGWNQYGGWRIGIRSFDNKRYYYYAHLRQNYPYAEGLEEGSVVTAGDVIGYMGHTGYSTTENVNNIEVTHLHWGLELVFDEEQKESDNEIWIDVYPLTCFLAKHTQEVQKVEGTREWIRTTKIREF